MKREAIESFLNPTDYTGFDPIKIARIPPFIPKETIGSTTEHSKLPQAETSRKLRRPTHGQLMEQMLMADAIDADEGHIVYEKPKPDTTPEEPK